MGLFDNRVPFKPFEYPEYYTEGWLKQAQAFWLHTEIPMQSDIKDWNEHLTKEEKNLVGNILLGFAQTECAVSDYWTTMVTNWFPKHESLGLEDFEAFLHEPATAERFNNLADVSNNYTYKDLKENADARQEVARSLAIFSAFTEGVALYSSFAVLYSFQMRNKLKGIGQQMKWSVRDESLHSRMGCQLFKHMCDEYPELLEDSKESIQEAAKLIQVLEHKYIDKMFEMGDLENLKKEDLKNFINQRLNEKLNELGYESLFEYDKNSAAELEWFYHLTGGHTHTDFFALRPTDYSKANEGEDWDDIF